MDVSQDGSASRYEALMADEKKGVDMAPKALINKLTSWISTQHWFAGVMLGKMMKNTHKTGWKGMQVPYLRFRIGKECEELDEAIQRAETAFKEGRMGDYYDALRDIIEECADISNFAMMTADNAKDLLR